MLQVWQVTIMPHHTCLGFRLTTLFSAQSVWAQDSASPSQSLVAITSLSDSGESCPGASSFQPLQKEHILLPVLISQHLTFDLLSTNLFCTKHKAVTKQSPQGCLVIWFWFSGFFVLFCLFLITNFH